ncbi:MAG: MFS transporter, partial [Candidatus Pacebacteria bacterium]|nr:MFS transporter [Candidatus Paceibacterota bacterium]
SWFPKMEKATFDVSLVYFLLMFGFKIFSLYYPLFLISIGFSVLNIGSIYLLTYSVIAISSVIINYYIHKFNPSKVAAFGIAGYGIFALLMLLSGSHFFISWIKMTIPFSLAEWIITADLSGKLIIFYIAQIVLGFSAAAWLVSLRLILMKSEPKNKSRSFGWFYSMPHYASAIAPAIGGIVIWKFGFTGVFALSVLIQFANAIYAYARLNRNCRFHGSYSHAYSADIAVDPVAQKGFALTCSEHLSLKKYDATRGELLQCSQRIQKNKKTNLIKNYIQVFSIIKSDKIFIIILISLFSVLILGGIYRAFFVLFLENMSFSQEEIIKFISIASVSYLPLSVIVIQIIGKLKNNKVISMGIVMEGFVTIILGLFASVISLLGLFTIMVFDSLGALSVGSGKSALLSKKLKNYQEEASVFDTILTTLGPAFGALIGGMAILYIGFQNTFLYAGVIVFLLGFVSWFVRVNYKK